MSAVQQAFRENHGLQCGFCTPGMVMASTSLLAENPHPSEQEVREGLEGNFCRCTGYHNIVRSVLAAAEKLSEGSGQTEAEVLGVDEAVAALPDAGVPGAAVGGAGRQSA